MRTLATDLLDRAGVLPAIRLDDVKRVVAAREGLAVESAPQTLVRFLWT